jgi:hypothetical protein
VVCESSRSGLGVAGKLPIQKKWGDFFGQISVEIFFTHGTCVLFKSVHRPKHICVKSHTCSHLLSLCNFAQV